jgi:hypothetical protein
MDVVRPNMPLQDFNVVSLADLSHKVSQPDPDLAPQYRLAVLRDEHEVVMALVNAM